MDTTINHDELPEDAAALKALVGELAHAVVAKDAVIANRDALLDEILGYAKRRDAEIDRLKADVALLEAQVAETWKITKVSRLIYDSEGKVTTLFHETKT